MSYPVNVAELCFGLVPDSSNLDLAVFGEQEGIGYILHWDTATLGPQPTEQELAAVTQEQVDQARWERLRTKAQEALADQQQLTRAVVLELLEYANAERAKFNLLLQWLGGQTTLVNRGQLSALQLVEATPLQARDAIAARINCEGS